MRIVTDEKQLMILEIVSSSDEPLGSWTLVEKFEEKGISVSPATIGRLLNQLERLGYLKKERNKGRIITPKGENAIHLGLQAKQMDQYRKTLDELINSDVIHNYLMVLEARKAIERTTAHLAARNISGEEIEQIEKVLEQQEKNYAESRSIAQNDIDFHRLIAGASRNKVLESLYIITSMMGQQSELFEHIRKSVGAPYMVSHHKIFEAIRNHQPEEAERCMIEHIDNLCKDVSTYWDKYYPKT